MKRIALILVISTITAWTLVSCVKGTITPGVTGNNNNNNGAVTATISSQTFPSYSFSSTSVVAYKYDSANTSKSVIEIFAYDGKGNDLTLYFLTTGTGTYNINSTSSAFQGFGEYINQTPSEEYLGYKGTITISSISSSSVTGSFNFRGPNLTSASDSVNVASGSFNVKYTVHL